MVSHTNVRETIIASLTTKTLTEVKGRQTHEQVEISRKELAQISASIKTTHASFPEGPKYGYAAAIM